jgi:hypothetical protein
MSDDGVAALDALMNKFPDVLSSVMLTVLNTMKVIHKGFANTTEGKLDWTTIVAFVTFIRSKDRDPCDAHRYTDQDLGVPTYTEYKFKQPTSGVSDGARRSGSHSGVGSGSRSGTRLTPLRSQSQHDLRVPAPTLPTGDPSLAANSYHDTPDEGSYNFVFGEFKHTHGVLLRLGARIEHERGIKHFQLCSGRDQNQQLLLIFAGTMHVQAAAAATSGRTQITINPLSGRWGALKAELIMWMGVNEHPVMPEVLGYVAKLSAEGSPLAGVAMDAVMLLWAALQLRGMFRDVDVRICWDECVWRMTKSVVDEMFRQSPCTAEVLHL